MAENGDNRVAFVENDQSPVQIRHGDVISLDGGKPRLFSQLAAEVQSRDGQQNKPLACLMNGERALWEAQRTWLPEKTIGILDLFHVMERLWVAAYCFPAEGSRQTEVFVTGRLRMLLEGKIGYLLGGLRRMATRLRGEKRKKLQTANRSHLKGPAGENRHEVDGRWRSAMLHPRTIYLNGDWQTFLQHRIEVEQTTLYSQAA